MPLIQQQSVVVVTGNGLDALAETAAIAELRRVLETYPPVRIVSIAVRRGRSTTSDVMLTAVVETV